MQTVTQFLACLALIIGYLLIQVHSQHDSPISNYFEIKGSAISTNKFCKRNVQATKDDASKSVKFTTTSLCVADRKNGTAIGAFSSMDYFASIAKFPVIGMKAKTTVKVVTPITKVERALAIVVGSAFGIDRIVEYQDSNGVEGFQPGNDTVVRSFNLREQAWKIMDVSKKTIDGSNGTYIYQALVEANVTGLCTIRMSAVISSALMQFTSPKVAARTGIVQVLSPSSLKVSFELLNIQYSQQNSFLALGALVAFRGTRRDKLKTENEVIVEGRRSTTSYENPDDANDDQTVVQFDNDLSTQLDGFSASLPRPFFSFQKFISKYSTVSPSTVTRGKLVYTPWNTVENLSADETHIKTMADTTGAVVARFWVSLTERVENAVWDPSTGTPENADYLTTSSASQINMFGLLVALISLIICNLL